MKKEERMATDIFEHIGGKGNIQRLSHCMTRLRLQLKDDSKANIDALKKIDGVMGVIDDDTLQIVVGPGTVNRVAAEMSKVTGLAIGEEANPDDDDLTFSEKAARDNAKR
ncbi:PTS glucose/sucrose transporter subunit IIB, partial [Microvirga sp. 3-52]|nr:PTS glucose/sucrose transporter subunit IIB [Microvirga sp. 3-52]